MLRIFGKAILKAIEDTIVTHDGIEHAGYLSFMGLLALFPFLVFIIALAGFLGEGELGKEFILLMRGVLPDDAMAALLPRIDEITQGPPRGLLTISTFAAIWTASSAVEGYRTILNRAFNVATPPAYIWRRLLSVFQLVVFAILIVLGMATLILAPDMLSRLDWLSGETLHQWGIAETLSRLQIISGTILFMLVALAYYALPNVKQQWRSVLPGAFVTIMLWAMAVEGLQLYLSSFEQVNLIYGSLAGVIAALLFFYVINLIFIFGAELNHQLRNALRLITTSESTAQEPPQ